MDGPVKTSDEIISEIKELCLMTKDMGTGDTRLTKLTEQLHRQIAEHKQIDKELSEDKREDAVERLHERIRLNQILLDAMPCVALLLHPGNREIVASNRAAVEVGAVPGRTCYETWKQRDSSCPWCLAPKLWATGEAQHLQVEALDRIWDAHWLPVSKDLYLHFAFDITERIEAQAELRESDQRFRRSIVDSPFPIMIHAEDGEVLQINKVWTELTGYQPEEIPTLSAWIERAYGEHKNVVESRIDKIFDCETRVDEGEYTITSKDGKTLTWDFSSASLGRLPDGRRMVISIAKDVTEHKRAERALRETEEYFRDFFDNGPVGYHIFGPDKIITDTSKAELAMIGYTKDEIVGKKTWADLIIPEQRTQFKKHWHDVATKGQVRDLEYTLVHKDGHHIDVVLNASARFDENGSLINTRGTILDITARKKAENMLRESEQRLCSFMDSATDGFMLLDSELTYIDANKAALQIAGLGREDVIGKNIVDVIPDIKETGRYDEYKKTIRTGTAFHVFDLIPHPKFGDKHIELKVFKVGDGLGMILTDITKRKKAEEQARKQQSQLAHFSRLATAGELASDLAHEINQPLGAISAYAEAALQMLDSGAAESPEFREATEQISAQAQRGGKIVRRMRDFVSRRNPRRSTTDLNEIVREATDLVEHYAQHGGITPELDLADGPLMVVVDSIQIQQVVVNLVQNAVDAMDEADTGECRLTVRTSKSEEGGVLVTVEDNGSGLGDGNSEKIFESFYTTKPDGLGIGLSICRSIIEDHKGRIWTTPNPDGGTIFTFTLPPQ